MMKKLEAKYAALQVVPVIDKLGNPKVGFTLLCYLVIRHKLGKGWFYLAVLSSYKAQVRK